MSKKNRICFYPARKIGDEIFKKLEELGFEWVGLEVIFSGCKKLEPFKVSI